MQKQSKNKDEKYIQVCPNCKSIDISQDKSTIQQIGLLPTRYVCNNCSHTGFSFPEVLVSELEKFKEDAEKDGAIDKKKDNTPLVDDSYGKFEVRFVWKIVAPFVLISGAIMLFYEPLAGFVLCLIGLVMMYITYFKKRKLRDD